ncbi:hypothetical protein OKA05_28560 [Luteolibacter arcticus]|uniref:Uncharacterized protein n=1 Tax=Luteolibacter arcticus TaxID=1581411 RepID=A0ABT3GST9_9BACT|nr:hypothetical protein [Luteolibacter arcticus]MCW1926538.1 hypothetical protein [Luteolibacter arcticus]
MITLTSPALSRRPLASAHPFPYPLAAGALESFCHPRCRVFSRVVRHPESGAVMAANGCVALRVTRGPVTYDDALPQACPHFIARVGALPWDRFGSDARRIAPAPWRALEPVRGDLHALGLDDLWPNDRMTLARPVWIAESVLVPLAVLQLIARLPRVELRLDGATDFMLLRFSGGEGIVANRWRKTRGADMPAHSLTLFTPPAALLPGAFV